MDQLSSSQLQHLCVVLDANRKTKKTGLLYVCPRQAAEDLLFIKEDSKIEERFGCKMFYRPRRGKNDVVIKSQARIWYAYMACDMKVFRRVFRNEVW
jgi:hypothetical protein